MSYTAMGFTEFGGPEVFRKMELELQPPNPNQVKIRVEYTSVNFADVKARKGEYSISGPPYIPGLDFLGIVTEAGSERGAHLVGKRVIGFGDTGSYGSEVLASLDLVFEIPDSISSTTAAASPLLLGTTYALLNKNQGLKPGQNLLIHAAAGGIGLTSVQIGRQMGAKSIIGLVSRKSKSDAVLKMGADHVIVTEENPNYSQIIKELIPEGIDYILNSAAGDTFSQDLELLNPHGQLVVFGMASGKPGVVTSDQLHQSSRTIAGFSFGHLRRTNPAAARELFLKALPLLTDGKVAFDQITEFSLYDVSKAHAAIESRETVGKLLLRP
jgi:NADPH2:quinone reductase